MMRKGMKGRSLKGLCAIPTHAGVHRADSRPQGKQAWGRIRRQ